ncbi:MAG: hypothetical protein SGILL_004602 [Bacillariaceae sp.]
MDTGVDDDDAQAEQQLNLLRALQAAEMGEQNGIPPHVLQEMIQLGMDPNDPESIQAILQMMAQQEQENARPEEHYLTIAQNGMSPLCGMKDVPCEDSFSIVNSPCFCFPFRSVQV